MEKKYDMLISALDAIGYTRETDPVKLKTIARNALKGFRSAQHTLAPDGAVCTCKVPYALTDVCSKCGKKIFRPAGKA